MNINKVSNDADASSSSSIEPVKPATATDRAQWDKASQSHSVNREEAATNNTSSKSSQNFSGESSSDETLDAELEQAVDLLKKAVDVLSNMTSPETDKTDKNVANGIEKQPNTQQGSQPGNGDNLSKINTNSPSKPDKAANQNSEIDSSQNGGNDKADKASQKIDAEKDLFIMGYDFKPDPDDLQSAVASKMVVDKLGLNGLAVSGTTGNQEGKSLESKGNELLTKLYGEGGFEDANSNSAVENVANRIAQTIDNGGKVHWSEGGQTQFADKVMNHLSEQGYDTKENVNVFQHSTWNEKHSGDLSGIKSTTNYQKIDDGNDSGNDTAAFRGDANDRKQQALESNYGQEWKLAMSEGTYGEQVDFDFSDTVELINGALGMDNIKSIDDFWEYFGEDDNGIKTSGGES